MLWSLIKIVLFVVVIAAITFGAGQIIDTGGSVNIQFGDQEISISPMQAVLAIVLFIAALWVTEFLVGLAISIFKFFNGDETAITRYFGRNKEKRGFDALTDGMVAMAAGEGRTAIKQIATAERYLDKPELTNLISAQAAELNGDTDRAMKYYKQLLDNDRTRFVGVHGIMKQKLADGDTDTALKLAEKAFALRPNHGATLQTLFDLQTEKSEWQGAQKTIEAKVRTNNLPKDVGKRREAVVALADARQMLDAGDIEAGKDAALNANKLSPALVPAAVLASEMHMLNNNNRAATAVLKKAWGANPHPDLAAALAEVEPNETPTARLKRFAVLTKQHPENSETKLLKAELALADEDFPAARRAARELAQSEPTTRSLTIMAAIEKGEGASEQVVRGWLNKALDAPRGPQWVCGNCSNIHAAWTPRCENCAGFDTLEWKVPPTSADLQSSTAMLGFTAGMLTGEAEKQPDTDVPDAEIITPDESAQPH
ncbi:heme biosynthesis protein HemY [Amylibacter kogurei]|uniref:Heme biosynthesis protein HemY n=1 Tax=Paramylibacter kogurei TaxID=1889778 RepID=A0A2G5KAW2_9RHOB|nr:heme biosynthesis HemY N-terminal domain-containing protein [Amylibacter kogurei]PIB26656.1 heme biosynthesis protein HemY [Amylibacter kogurei]